MSEISKTDARVLLERMLADLLDPSAGAGGLSEYFTADYRQEADGVELDYEDFIRHAAAVKASLKSGRATIETLAVDGPCIADIHTVDIVKTDGRAVTFKVIAFFWIRDGKINRCVELTHLVRGSDDDRDLGHRT